MVLRYVGGYTGVQRWLIRLAERRFTRSCKLLCGLSYLLPARGIVAIDLSWLEPADQAFLL